MSLTADNLRRLAALNLPSEAMGEVLSIIADITSVDEARKAKDRARKATVRGNSEECPRNVRGKSADSPPPKKVSPTPPSKNNPLPVSPNGDTAAAPPVIDHFEEFRRIYPRREGANPWKAAEVSFGRAIRKGADPLVIIACARSLREQHPSPTPFVPQAVTWLNQERWKDMEPTGPPPGKGPPVEEIFARARSAAG
jgi:hypothetical protein